MLTTLIQKRHILMRTAVLYMYINIYVLKKYKYYISNIIILYIANIYAYIHLHNDISRNNHHHLLV